MAGKRAMLFVDAQNLELAAEHHYEASHPLDYVALLEVLTADYDLVRPYLFDSHPPDEDKADFYRFLRRELGFRVVSKELREENHHYTEKGVDIALATELIAQGFDDNYEVAILVSGDADFDQAVRYAQDRGKRVVGASFPGATSERIRDAVDEFVPLDEHDETLQRE